MPLLLLPFPSSAPTWADAEPGDVASMQPAGQMIAIRFNHPRQLHS